VTDLAMCQSDADCCAGACLGGYCCPDSSICLDASGARVCCGGLSTCDLEANICIAVERPIVDRPRRASR
jgi:hypothetical protein